MEQGKLKERFKEIVNDYMQAWCDKHEYYYEEDMWVANDYGGVCCVGDLFVSFNDVRYDIDNDLEEGVFEEWYWYILEIKELGCEKTVNLDTYAKGYRPYSDKQIEDIRQAKIGVDEAEKRFEELLKNIEMYGEGSN